jgi:hypothetical protein
MPVLVVCGSMAALREDRAKLHAVLAFPQGGREKQPGNWQLPTSMVSSGALLGL